MITQFNRGGTSKKGFFVPLIIAIVALLAVGGYAYEKQKSAKQPTETVATQSASSQTTTTDSQISVSANNTMSLKDLLSLSSPQECTTTFSSNGVETHGTVKVAQGKVRADYETTVSGKTWNVHALVDGNNSYTWIDGMAQGFKVAMSSDVQSSNSNSSKGADVNQKMNVVCKSWNIDASVLSLPANISFMTIGGAGGAGNVTIPSGATNVNVKSY